MQFFIKSKKTFITDEWEKVIKNQQIDIVIEATGDPIQSVEHVLKSFEYNKHVVMVTVEADAIINPGGIAFTLGAGTVTIEASAVTSVTGNALTMATGSVSIIAEANVTPDATPLTITVKDATAITWSEIDPGVNQTWVEIKPY